jgi:hypothetical protein
VFTVSNGGGFMFDMLHCDACGRSRSVRHQELGDIHLRFIKGLGRPYAVSRASMDRRIQEEYSGEPLSRDEYHAAVEATMESCSCGGRFAYDAPARCPTCRSTDESWSLNPEAPIADYD